MKLLISNFIEEMTSPSRSGPYIDPETSIRNTKLDAGKASEVISRALIPIRTNRCASFHGQIPVSVEIATGSFPSGFL